MKRKALRFLIFIIMIIVFVPIAFSSLEEVSPGIWFWSSPGSNITSSYNIRNASFINDDNISTKPAVNLTGPFGGPSYGDVYVDYDLRTFYNLTSINLTAYVEQAAGGLTDWYAKCTDSEDYLILTSYSGPGNVSVSLYNSSGYTCPVVGDKIRVTYHIREGLARYYTYEQWLTVNGTPTTSLGIRFLNDVPELVKNYNLRLYNINDSTTYNLTVNNYTGTLNNMTRGVYNITFNAMHEYLETNYTGITLLYGDNNLTLNISRVFNYFVVDEKTGYPFDFSNITAGKLWFDDNATYMDLKVKGSNGTFYRNCTDKLRLDLEYLSGDIVVRFVDINLLDSNISLCANKEGVLHTEQLIISGVPKVAFVQNSFTKCYVVADYTRFAYQSALSLRAFTIDSNYEFRTLQYGNGVVLGAVDGAVQSVIDIGELEFQNRDYKFDIVGDTVSFINDYDRREMQILYDNNREDNIANRLVITREDTDAVLFDKSDFLNPNNWIVIFDYSTLNVTNNTLFKASITRETIFGEQDSVNRYFNILGRTGILKSELAFALALLTLFFGLTFTVTRLTLGWFGMIMVLIAITILSLAIIQWYITFLMAACFVVLVIQVLLFLSTYYTTVV